MKKFTLMFAVSLLLAAFTLPAFADSGGGYNAPAQLSAADMIDVDLCQCAQCDGVAIIGVEGVLVNGEEGAAHSSVGAIAVTAETGRSAFPGGTSISPPDVFTDRHTAGDVRVSPHILAV